MRVLFDATYARRAPLSGTAVYIERVCAELERLDVVELIPVANERRRAPAGGGLGSLRNLAADQWWLTVELPRLARRERAQLVHHPLPARSPATRLPQVVTVADLAFERLPVCFDRRFRLYAHVTHRAAARAAARVLTISETTAADVRELWRVPAERITVARLGPGQALPPIERERDPRHFLYVGDEEPRKNLGDLLAAYALYRARARAPLELVLAGSAHAHAPGVRSVRGPSPDALAELYGGAAALVQPSLYEGFGLPALEAMSVGTPVIAVRSPGTVEVCADAVRYAAPRDPADLAAAMEELASSPELAVQLANRGHRRAAEFSWASCARAHLAAYSLAVA